MADALLLAVSVFSPIQLEQSGYRFLHPDLGSAPALGVAP
jgi:hypothetical protein